MLAATRAIWYFYAFWFPQYLEIVHPFTLRQIGKTAWIPLFTAMLGNLAGEYVFSLLRHFRAPVVTYAASQFSFFRH
jgi:hypothetical protein